MMARLLTRATAYLRDEAGKLFRKVKGALTYPAIMFSFRRGPPPLFLLAFVLPKFHGPFMPTRKRPSRPRREC